MKILFYTPIFPPLYSGATFQAISLARKLEEKNVKVTFLCLRDSSEKRSLKAYDTSVHAGHNVVEIPIQNYKEPYRLIKHFELIIRLFIVLFCMRKQYDIIHSHNFQFPYASIGLAGFFLRKKTISKITMSADLDYDKIGRLTGALYGRLVHSFDRVIAISSEIAATLSKKDFTKDQIIPIPNGVDMSRFTPIEQSSRDALKKKLDIQASFLVLFVGGVTYRKGVDDLMEIWLEVSKQHPEARLLIAGPRSASEGATGDTYCYEEALEFVKQHHLNDSVSFIGKVKDITQYYQCADVLVLPSKLEGMPNVVLEAMAGGVPCIANEVSGVNAIITPGVNGEIVKIGDINTFKQKLLDIAANPIKRASYSKEALSTIRNNFSLDVVADTYRSLYSDLLH